MRFHNKRENNMYGYQEEKEVENSYTRGTIPDPTDFEKTQMEFWGKDKMVEVNEKIREYKNPNEITVPFDAQLLFWNALNDMQMGQFEPMKLTKMNTWLVAKTGTWLIQKNSSGYYALKKNDHGIPTLPGAPEYPKAFFDLTYGKVPNDILQQIVAFFREIMKRYNNAEAFIQIYWDKEESKYIIHVPKQRISQGSVAYDATENLNSADPSRYIFVYECHSHNSMGAFWSGTDDRDEKELRVYGVFGRLDQDEYENKHRFFVGGEMVDVDISNVFDIPVEEKKEYVVTYDKKQYKVGSDKLILDTKPKYIFHNDKGEKFYIPVDSVVLCKNKIDYPELWFKSINVNLPKEATESRGRSSGPTIPLWKHMFPDRRGTAQDFTKDPFHHSDGIPDYRVEEDEEVDENYEEMAWEMQQAVGEVMMQTDGFRDAEASYVFFETIEGEKALGHLDKQLQAYFVKSRQLQEGPTDGKY